MSRLALLLALLWLATPAAATVYQYFDEDGTMVVYSTPEGEARRPVPEAPPQGDRKPISRRDKARHDVPELFQDVSYQYYQVAGKTYGQLIAAANVAGPVDAGTGQVYPAQTSWKMGLSYEMDYTFERGKGELHVSLRLRNIKVWADIIVLLPEPMAPSALGPADASHWEKFMGGLIEHEHDHVRLVQDPSEWEAAAERLEALAEITIPHSTGRDPELAITRAVRARTSAIGHDLAEAISQRNAEYDRLTEHGLKPEMRKVFFASP